jgi:type I restriction enzyme M protein
MNPKRMRLLPTPSSKELIDDLKGSTGESAKKELKALKAQETAIAAFEKRIKDAKGELRTLTDELEHKLQLKRFGGDEFKSESQQLLKQVDSQLAALNAGDKEEKKRITALQKDRAALEERIAKTDALVASIGGQLTEAEAKLLILKKLYDLANVELNRYLNAEKRRLIQLVENLWDKYAVSSRDLESGRIQTCKALDGFLSRLGYLEGGLK